MTTKNVKGIKFHLFGCHDFDRLEGAEYIGEFSTLNAAKKYAEEEMIGTDYIYFFVVEVKAQGPYGGVAWK
jgi:hypothetical protein